MAYRTAMKTAGFFYRRAAFGVLRQNYTTASVAIKQLLLSELDTAPHMKQPVVTSRAGLNLKIAGQTNKILNFATNDYLGLSSHPEVVEAGKRAMDRFGAGLGAIHLMSGYTDIHKEFEEKLARFHGKEDAFVYSSGYGCNVGLFHVLLSEEDAVISDEFNHASIIDGIRLCKAKRFVYKHVDMRDLENKLQSAQNCRRRLIVTEGVFSMEAVAPPLPEICQLAEKYDALLMSDESHAVGVLGHTGRGCGEYFGLESKVDIITSSLSKSIGTGLAGGYTCGTKELIALLRQRSRSAVFSAALPPSSAGCMSKTLDLINENPEILEKLHQKADRFRRGMAAIGVQVMGDPGHPICPVVIGDSNLTNMYVRELQEHGILVLGIWYPIVPKGKGRIRFVVTAAHSDDDIDWTVETFATVARHLRSRDPV